MKLTKKKVIGIIIGVACVLLIVVLLNCFTSVPAGYTGILTTYGKIEDKNLTNGFHLKMPYQKVVLIDNHVQTMKISAGMKNATTSDTAETLDQQLIPTFEFEIQYQLNADMAFDVYAKYGADYEKILITNNALQFIKETFANFKAEEIVKNKQKIPMMIREKLNEVTSSMGVNILRVNMVTYDFSPEYTSILEQRALLTAQLENTQLQQKNETIAAQTQYDVAVKQAEKDAETQRIAAENENSIAIARANATAEKNRIQADNDAYVKRTTAEADRDARLASAEAEKAELEAKASGLNDYIIQQLFIERWDGKLIPSFGSTGFTFANLTDIMKDFVLNQQD